MGQTYLVEELRLRDFSHRNCEAQCPGGGGIMSIGRTWGCRTFLIEEATSRRVYRDPVITGRTIPPPEVR